MILQESNGADPKETLAIGISFGNSNSGIAYTTSVGTFKWDYGEAEV